MPRFGNVVTAMVTPFGPDGSLDLDAAVAVARHLASTGSDALVVAGTTGEGPVLTDAERIELFRAVVGAVTTDPNRGTSFRLSMRTAPEPASSMGRWRRSRCRRLPAGTRGPSACRAERVHRHRTASRFPALPGVRS